MELAVVIQEVEVEAELEGKPDRVMKTVSFDEMVTMSLRILYICGLG